MSDYAKFCPKCYTFFRDPDSYSKHVEVCCFAKDKKEAEAVKEPKKAAGGRKQATAEKEKMADDGRQATAEGNGDSSTTNAENPLTSATVSDEGEQPSATPDSPPTKAPKFKT